MYDHCNSQTTWSDHNIFDLTSSHFDCHCMLLTYNHKWSPQCSHYTTVPPKHSDDGEEKSGTLHGPEHLAQEWHYIHDNTIDAPPGTGPNDIHDSILEDDVSIVPNTKELFEEQDEKENVEAGSKIMLLSPIEEVFQVWKHHNATLWSPLQGIIQTPIPSNQYLLPVAQLVPYTQMYPQYVVQDYKS